MNQLTIDKLSVLLVEPSGTQQKIIEHLLRELGIVQFVAVEKGHAALDRMAQYKPDLVISALYLPDITGTELVETMRAEKSLEDITFMLISSETSFRMLDPIRQAGTIAILPKPFNKDQLKAALHSTINLIDPQRVQWDEGELEDLKVLIVDDSLTARKHICKVLKGLGFNNITQAENGVAALEAIKVNFFDFIVTDYNMPEMDGKELVENIRKHSNQAGIPILMVTSENDDNRLAAVQKVGVSAICDKPFEPSTVRELIENIIRS